MNIDKNWVGDISIGNEVERIDFYDGIVLQSSGNQDDIFELIKFDDTWACRTIYTIPGRDRYSEFKDTGDFEVEKVIGHSPHVMPHRIRWFRTIYTNKLDKVVIRESKLNELDI